MQILCVQKKSLAEKAGLKIGDKIISIGDYNIEDILDYLHFEQEERVEIEFERNGEFFKRTITNKYCKPLGIEFDGDGIKAKHCQNKCIFCFVDQLPKDENLRKTLRFKDDDYRLSFLNGTYITLTNLIDKDLQRIKRLKLSPLYVSVHTTDADLRGKMLGSKNPRPVLKTLKELKEAGVDIHAQIVYCPSVNDDLEKSTRELSEVCASLAIVPVGLTKYKNPDLKAVSKNDALKVLTLVDKLQAEFLTTLGTRFVWCADEFYVLANAEIPNGDFYENYDQIENGVGLFSQFNDGFDYALDECNSIKIVNQNKGKRLTIITGVSAFDFIQNKVNIINDTFKTDLQVIQVSNSFFGDSVTVAGLLSGGDILVALKNKDLGDKVLIPSTALKEFDIQFLDNLTLDDLSKELGVPCIKVFPDGENFVNAVLGVDNI